MTARHDIPTGRHHLEESVRALRSVEPQVARVQAWGRGLVDVLGAGGRMLVAGNGGSAAQAQHLTAELVGRYRLDRRPFSAIALHAETSSLTAIANDYGAEEAFARQVRAHGRAGDVLLALSTSGASANVLAAVDAARQRGLVTWALTGARPNPLAEQCDDALCVASPYPASVQEAHLVLIHILCAEVDTCAGLRPAQLEVAW